VGNMNGQTRKKLYSIISDEDGEYCRGCGKLAYEGQLVVDHRDNNNSNNSRENLQLLCRSCNYKKNPRRPVDSCVGEYESGDESELQNGKKNEPLFRDYVLCRLNECQEKRIPEKELVYAGAEYVGNSPTTCARYLAKLCSSEGPLRRVRLMKTVLIKYKEEWEHV